MFQELYEAGPHVPMDDMVLIAGLGGQTVFDALSGEMAIPKFAEFRAECSKIFEATAALTGGKVSDYIPQLERVDPNKSVAHHARF